MLIGGSTIGSKKARSRTQMPRRSQKTVAAIDKFPVNHARFCHELMGAHWTGRVDVQDLVSVSHQVVGNEHAVTLEVNSLGAHVGSTRAFSQCHQLCGCSLEFRRQHVVCIVSEAVVSQSDVRRLRQCFLSASAQLFHPDILDSHGRQWAFQALAVEMRETARHRKGSDVDKSPDGMGLKGRNKLIQGSCGVPDGVEGSQAQSRSLYVTSPERSRR
jgi:hypothetical protein